MNDCIYREAAFNAVLKLVPKVDDDGYCWVIRGDAAKAIASIQAADVRPVVKAHWIKCNRGAGYKCSVCKARVSNADVFNGNHKYCYKCGADMSEVSNESG